MNNILVTGGAGFIGSSFVRNAVNRDLKVINLDILNYAGNLKNLDDIEDRKNYVFIKGDICDEDLVNSIFKKHKINIVVNFAAESHVDRSIMGSNDFLKTNILGTGILMDIARKFNIDRFLQISTDEVYGDLENESTEKFTEKSQICPSNPYAASKAGADMLVGSYHRTHKFPAIISRCSNNFGPYQFPEKFIPLIIYRALQNKSIPLYGDGFNIRDWIFVEDHVETLFSIIENGKIGEIYNIGSENEIKNIDILKMILNIMNKSESLIEYVKDRKGHDRRYGIDPSKIKKELNFQSKFNFEIAIEKTIQWYKDNMKWVEECIDGSYRDYYNNNYKMKE